METQEKEVSKVSFGLGLGIFLLPYVFSWLTLRKGYSTAAKGTAFSWLGFCAITHLTTAFLFVKAVSDNAPAVSAAINEVKTASVERTPSEEKAELGQSFRLGNYSYTINKVVKLEVIRGGYIERYPSPGGIFIVVSFTIKNEGNQTETVLSDDFKLVDKQGREFSPSSQVTSALLMAMENKDFMLTQLQPGLAKKSYTGFEVPKEVAKEGYSLIVPEKGWGKNNRVRLEF